MTRYGDWLEGQDPEGPRSRFNRHPAVAFVPGDQLEYELHSGAELEDARQEAVRTAIGPWALEPQPELGAPRLVDGGYGIGAEAWAVVLEWAAQGAVGGMAWVAVVAAARRLRGFLERFRADSEAEPIVSAGAAHLLAVDAVLRQFDDERGPLKLEAVEDASTVGGQEPPTLSYGEEPWIVLLIGGASLSRYVVVIESDGAAVGALRVALGPRGRAFAQFDNETGAE